MSRIKLGSKGVLYTMVNESMPGLVKIGATTDDPRFRAKQLSASTSAPTPFVCAYSREVWDVNAAEALAHEMVAEHRVNDGREYFAIPVHRAIAIIDLIAGGTGVRMDPPTPMSELFNSFPDDGSARTLTPEERTKCRELEAQR